MGRASAFLVGLGGATRASASLPLFSSRTSQLFSNVKPIMMKTSGITKGTQFFRKLGPKRVSCFKVDKFENKYVCTPLHLWVPSSRL